MLILLVDPHSFAQEHVCVWSLTRLTLAESISNQFFNMIINRLFSFQIRNNFKFVTKVISNTNEQKKKKQRSESLFVDILSMR